MCEIGGTSMQGNVKEWPETLDMNALFAIGWQPEPFQEFVLKVHSRCDLACDYCYVYTMADQGWRGQPVRMSVAMIHQAAARIAEHARDQPAIMIGSQQERRLSGRIIFMNRRNIPLAEE